MDRYRLEELADIMSSYIKSEAYLSQGLYDMAVKITCSSYERTTLISILCHKDVRFYDRKEDIMKNMINVYYQHYSLLARELE